jgi:hypothetical protein
MIEVKVIKDSVSEAGVRLTTLQLKFHRYILPEFNTHRVFSRNFSSSRAIPVARLLGQVWSNPAMPVYWGQNKAGMQASGELTGLKRKLAIGLWRLSAKAACAVAWGMMRAGLHKGFSNRVLEPYVWVNGIVTATEWDNFFALRDHEAAAPEIQALAREMKRAMDQSTPLLLHRGEWHLPYVGFNETEALGLPMACKVSAARCARVSYLRHDGSSPSYVEDLKLYERLVGSMPIHASPVEHQATPDIWIEPDCIRADWEKPDLHGNFKGWIQNRKLVESSFGS